MTGEPGMMPCLHGRRRRSAVLVGICLAAAVALHVGLPRHPDLRAFDAAAMSRIETTMWRHYYDQKYLALVWDLYSLSRDQYGFSPIDRIRIAIVAARAAQSFQPSTSRPEAEAALPWLEAYFRLLSRATPVSFDSETAARIELSWWQARREGLEPEDYGLAIGRISALLYGIDCGKIREAGVRRAKQWRIVTPAARQLRKPIGWPSTINCILPMIY
jgi:hypothetical protein